VNLEDFLTNNLAKDLVAALTCTTLNSEGKGQSHDFSDPYRRWGWAYGHPVRKTYRKCLRCGYRARILRVR
jgi:hypothetical protein